MRLLQPKEQKSRPSLAKGSRSATFDDEGMTQQKIPDSPARRYERRHGGVLGVASMQSSLKQQVQGLLDRVHQMMSQPQLVEQGKG
jgi:hypothetical protein